MSKRTNAKAQRNGEVVRYGDTTADVGMAIVPRLFLRFYRHLESDGERLTDEEAMLLVHVLGEAMTDPPAPLPGLEELPLAASSKSRRRWLAKLRRMGLLFVAVRDNELTWDLSNLTFNLERAYHARRHLSGFFTIGVELAPDVAQRILEGDYSDVPDKWCEQAQLCAGKSAGGGRP